MSNDDFLKLRKKWYEKLRKSNFVDIEAPYKNRELLLKQHDAFYFKERYTVKEFLEKQKYYQSATEFYNTHFFETSTEKEIWRLHADGMPVSAIAEKVKHSKDMVQRYITRLRKVMLGR